MILINLAHGSFRAKGASIGDMRGSGTGYAGRRAFRVSTLLSGLDIEAQSLCTGLLCNNQFTAGLTNRHSLFLEMVAAQSGYSRRVIWSR